MKYAFLVKNFKNLGVEQQSIFLAHAGTLLFCFFPWISVEPLYDAPYWNSAFGGATALLGVFIFILSLIVVLFFIQKLFEVQKVVLPLPEPLFFLLGGAEQIIFLILAWSVLLSVGGGFEASELRFGLSFSFLAQIVGIVGAYLYAQKDKKRTVRKFFQHPPVHQTSTQKSSEKILEKSPETPPPSELGGLFQPPHKHE